MWQMREIVKWEQKYCADMHDNGSSKNMQCSWYNFFVEH